MKDVTYNNEYDKRGFTLVELLAVIVVLAIVMLIAVNAVLPKMEEARRQAFAIEANGFLKAAMQYVVTESLTSDLVIDDSESKCVTVEELVDAGHSALNKKKYSGKVIITKSGNNFLYTAYLANGSYMVQNAGVKDGVNISVNIDDVDKKTSAFVGTCTAEENTATPETTPTPGA